jgi:mannose-6-phosphate isomerase-like protein (cupin superfamily)
VTIGPLTARHLVLRPGGATEPHSGELDASSVFVRAGRGRLVLGSDREALTEIDLDAGALTLVPAGVPFRLAADAGSTLRVSEQRLPLRTAFGP